MTGIVLLLLRIVIAAALYAFLGWTLWLLYHDLRQRSQSLASPPAPPLVLTQLEQALPHGSAAEDAIIDAAIANNVVIEVPITSGLPAARPYPTQPTGAPPAPLALLVFRITASEAILGRDPASQLYIDHPTISARHARLAYHHAQWWIEDLHSRNGTFLNDLPVEDAVVLTQGDELRCGALTFAVSFE